jgi:hypothetical protein
MKRAVRTRFNGAPLDCSRERRGLALYAGQQDSLIELSGFDGPDLEEILEIADQRRPFCASAQSQSTLPFHRAHRVLADPEAVQKPRQPPWPLMPGNSATSLMVGRHETQRCRYSWIDPADYGYGPLSRALLRQAVGQSEILPQARRQQLGSQSAIPGRNGPACSAAG